MEGDRSLALSPVALARDQHLPRTRGRSSGLIMEADIDEVAGFSRRTSASGCRPPPGPARCAFNGSLTLPTTDISCASMAKWWVLISPSTPVGDPRTRRRRLQPRSVVRRGGASVRRPEVAQGASSAGWVRVHRPVAERKRRADQRETRLHRAPEHDHFSEPELSPIPSRARASSDPAVVEAHRTPADLQSYVDHRGTAARAARASSSEGDRACYVMFRHDRRKGLPLFATVLYASDGDLLRRHFGTFSRHLLVRHRVLATLCELRIVGGKPPLSRLLGTPRPKMFKSTVLQANDIDYLYSELECLEW